MIDLIVGAGIGAFLGTGIAFGSAADSIHQSVKALDNRITESFKKLSDHIDERFDKVDASLDIIKSLQLLTIYGATKDDKGNIVYTAPDNSRIEYHIDTNDIRTYTTTGKLYTINGEFQPIKEQVEYNGALYDVTYMGGREILITRTIETKAKRTFVVHYKKVTYVNDDGEQSVTLKVTKLTDVQTGCNISVWMPEIPERLAYKWYNKKRVLQENMNLLAECRKERHKIFNAVKQFRHYFPELADIPLNLEGFDKAMHEDLRHNIWYGGRYIDSTMHSRMIPSTDIWHEIRVHGLNWLTDVTRIDRFFTVCRRERQQAHV